jgi:hypothetical protein
VSRYYDVQILNADGSLKRQYASFDPKTSAPLPGALMVEFDLPVAGLAQPWGAAMVRVWGISLQDLGQAADLNGLEVYVYGGMAKGLPLANPQQRGLLLHGQIQQAFGNWQGTDQTLDLIIMTGGDGNQGVPMNFLWRAGTSLSDAVKTTLKQAFPTYTATVNLSQNLVLGADEVGHYDSLIQFSQYLREISQSIIGEYRGATVVVREQEVVVFDGTSPTAPRLIEFKDLIGQVTWKQSGVITFTCVMRADFSVGDYVKLPRGQVFTTATALSQYNQGPIFQGVFEIDTVRHVGNSRQPDAGAWVTTFDAHGPVSTNGG